MWLQERSDLHCRSDLRDQRVHWISGAAVPLHGHSLNPLAEWDI